MKKIYVVFFLACLAHFSAQTVTQSFNEPVVGDVDKNYRLDTSAYTNGLPLNVNGNNCVWNYTNLSGIFPVVIDSFIAPLAVPGGSAYPTATYAQHRGNLYTFFKSTTSPQRTSIVGGTSSTLSLTFSDPAIVATYPVNFGYNQSDSILGTFKYMTTNGACVGNINVSADGLGTINFAGGISLQNVLRLKSVEVLTLSIGILPIGAFVQTIYSYYLPGKKFPILSHNYSSYPSLSGPPSITAYTYGSNNYFTVVGINESTIEKKDYAIFPNPFHDQLFIDDKNSSVENTYLFYDAHGAMILETNTISANTDKLVPGIYFLEIKNDRGTFHQKIIKE